MQVRPSEPIGSTTSYPRLPESGGAHNLTAHSRPIGSSGARASFGLANRRVADYGRDASEIMERSESQPRCVGRIDVFGQSFGVLTTLVAIPSGLINGWSAGSGIWRIRHVPRLRGGQALRARSRVRSACRGLAR